MRRPRGTGDPIERARGTVRGLGGLRGGAASGEDGAEEAVDPAIQVRVADMARSGLRLEERHVLLGGLLDVGKHAFDVPDVVPRVTCGAFCIRRTPIAKRHWAAAFKPSKEAVAVRKCRQTH